MKKQLTLLLATVICSFSASFSADADPLALIFSTAATALQNPQTTETGATVYSATHTKVRLRTDMTPEQRAQAEAVLARMAARANGTTRTLEVLR